MVSRIMSHEPLPNLHKSRGLHNKWGIAIVGTGLIARFHAQAVLNVPATRLVAFCGRDLQKTRRLAKEFSCDASVCLDDILKRPEVDVVMIATPSGTHQEIAVLAAAAGKHVLCEKPLEITPERVNAMISAHEQAGTQLGCIFQTRYTPEIKTLQKALEMGRFGTVTYAGAYVPWWREPAYYQDSSWHGTRELDGGGALMNQAIHMIDLLCTLMPPVKSVCACTSTIGHPYIETEDTAAAVIQFQGGAVGVIYGSTASWPGKPKRLEISGTSGSAVLTDDRLTTFSFRDPLPEDQEVFQLGLDKNSQLAIGAANPGAMTHALHAACLQDFILSLETGQGFQIDGASALRAVQVICAIYESAQKCCSVSLNPLV